MDPPARQARRDRRDVCLRSQHLLDNSVQRMGSASTWDVIESRPLGSGFF